VETLLRQHANGRDRILEFACGAGHYSNKIVNDWGVTDSILATDLSPDMIELAQEAFQGDRKMEFKVADAACERQLTASRFKTVFAAYLLNYCSSYTMLLSMCRTIRMNLAEGGVFITVNDGSHHDVSTWRSVTGFEKRLQHTGDTPQQLADFTPFTVVLTDPLVVVNGSDGLHFTNYWISEACLKKAFKEAGFKEVSLGAVKRSCVGTGCTVCASYVDNQVIMTIVASC